MTNMMALTLIIGFSLFTLSCLAYIIGVLMGKWELKPDIEFKNGLATKQLKLEWKAGLYIVVSFFTIAKHYKIEITWGW